MNLKEFGDNLFGDELRSMVQEKPYLAFIVLSALLEFIGKCLAKRESIHQSGHSSSDFYDAINKIESLKCYRIYNRKDKNKKYNLLYFILRCGMVHSGLPNNGIRLSSCKSDITQNTIGCYDFYSDLFNAWQEIKNIPDVEQYLRDHKGIVITTDIENSNNILI